MSFPSHHDGRHFFNAGAAPPRGFASVLKWLLTRRRETSPKLIYVKPSIPPRSLDSPSLLATFVNHSTVLLQQPGSNLLTDPIWSARCSPLPFIGPRRHRMPGIDLEHLPPIQIVLISHNHYDHLDLPTLRRLARRGGATFVAPLGVARLLQSRGIAPAHELEWGDSVAVAGITIHSVPACHFSGRGLLDHNRTLWCGYIIESVVGMIYFAADTGFGPHFAWIRDHFGPPRLALLPVGAYQPHWLMSPIHMNPDEAVEAHYILGAGTSVPIHYGTFQLGDEGIDTPRRRLEALGGRNPFRILNQGESALFT